ncbi:MAG: hypothetical protein V4543_04000 [Bacteroidota bacterium]
MGSVKLCHGDSVTLSAAKFNVIVNTIAGHSGSEYLDGQGTAAGFFLPRCIVRDNNGNFLIGDSGNRRIRKMTKDGLVTTIAGNGGPSGADGPALSVGFNGFDGITIGDSGNIYITDNSIGKIRKLSPAGIVTTIASLLENITGIAAGPDGFIYFTSGNTIKKVSKTGVISNVAGNTRLGFADGTADKALFNTPRGLVFDRAGNLFVSDYYNYRIRKITPTGAVSTLAGSSGGYANGTGTDAKFAGPWSLVTDSLDNIYLTERYWNSTPARPDRIRMITPDGTVSTIAGTGDASFNNGPGIYAKFNNAEGIALGEAGSIFITDSGNNLIRKIAAADTIDGYLWTNGTSGRTTRVGSAGNYGVQTIVNGCTSDVDNYIAVYLNPAAAGSISASGNPGICPGDSIWLNAGPDTASWGYTVSTFAGFGIGQNNGPAESAQFNKPEGIAQDAAGNTYVADYSNHTIRKISPEGMVSVFAGSGTAGDREGMGSAAAFNYPTDVAADSEGNIYVADYGNNRIKKISSAGMVSNFAGKNTAGLADGPGNTAMFNGPAGLACDKDGNILVTDGLNNKIRKITPAGIVTTIFDTVRFLFPADIALDKSGNVYVANALSINIVKITPTRVSYITNSNWLYPFGILADDEQNIFVSDLSVSYLTRIDSNGNSRLVAGGRTNTGMEDGDATSAKFNRLARMVFDKKGDILIADFENHRIRKIALQSPYLWSDGTVQKHKTIKEAGTYSLQIKSGRCISAPVSISVIMLPGYTPQITRSGDSLNAGPGGTAYEWYFNGLLIPAASGQIIPMHGPGSYTVAAITDSCKSRLSPPYLVTGFSAQIANENVFLVPNPAQSQFRIAGLEAKTDVIIRSLLGQVVYKGVADANTDICLQNLPAGLYEVVAGNVKLRLMKD